MEQKEVKVLPEVGW